MKSRAFTGVLGASAAAALLLVGSVASAAQTTTTGSWGKGGEDGQSGHMPPGVMGTVSAISGDTITLTSKGWGQNASAETYTVNANNANVLKSMATSSVGAIMVGDTVMVQGTVSGTNVTATQIIDGMMGGARGKGMGPGMGAGEGLSIQGNGQPVVGGTISGINGSTLTITNASNVTYSVDASSATVVKGNATSSISSLATGDRVIVQGSVNGTAVSAASVIDQGAAPSNASGNAAPRPMGIFGALGGFLHKLFGFF